MVTVLSCKRSLEESNHELAYRPVMSELEYRPVNPWQKHHCLWCANDATKEVVQREGNMTAITRCCDDPRCMRLSAQMCERTVAA